MNLARRGGNTSVVIFGALLFWAGKGIVMLAARVIITVGALVFGGLVPVLEITETHVFNQHWPGHARLHEVWQLGTNTALAVFCLWLVWVKREVQLAGLLGLFVTGGFLLSFFLMPGYGGSMKHVDGSELLLLGLNGGLVIYGILSLLFLFLIFRPLRMVS